MQGQTPGDAGRRVVRRERAWWQWVVGVALLGAAGAVAVVRYYPGLGGGQLRQFEPNAISVSSDLRPAAAVPAAPGELAGSNLLLVTYDTTRADRIGCYGNRDIETPAIDRLATEGVLFSKALAPAPTTLPSHSSIMTGLYPYHHGARANTAFRLGDENRTLAETLAAEGYATGATISAVVLDAQFGIGQGFEDYDDQVGEAKDEDEHDLRKIAQRTGDKTAALAEAWLRDHADQKFFLWLHLYDPHAPYRAPEAFTARHQLAYDAEIAFADAQMGRLLGVLDELGLTDDTLIVVAGDHGEGLGEHTELEHSSLIYDSTLRVPLVMRCGRRLGGGVHVDRWVSLVDTMPTVLSLLGIDAPGEMDGVDLTQPPAGDRPIFSEAIQGLADHGWAALLGVHDGDAKLIYGPWSEVYDLAGDPFETDNLFDARPELAARLQGRLEEFFGADLEMAASADPTHQPSPEMIEALQSLGYLSTGAAMPAAADRPHPLEMMPALTRMTAIIAAEDEIGLDQVIAGLERLAAANPDFATLHHHLGNALARSGDLAAAEDAYATCLELRPADPQPLLALAGLKIQQRKMDEAMTLYRRLVEQMPEHFEALYGLGKLLVAQGEYAEAIELYKRALVVRPRDLFLPDMITDAVVVLSRGDDVVTFFRQLLDTEPDLPMVRNALARLLAGRQEFQAAATVLRDGIELSPDAHELTNNLAFMIATCSDKEIRRPVEAILMMERVCEDTSYQDPRYLHTLSMVLASMYRLDESIDVAERARRLAVASDDARLTQLAPKIGISLQHFRKLKEEGHGASDAFKVPKEPEEATQGMAPVQPVIGRD